MKRSREQRSLCAISTGRSVQVSFRYDTSFSSSCSVIVRVSVVLKRTVGDSD